MKVSIFTNCSEARKNGYVQTVLGRRRYLPEISSPDPSKRAQAERQAVNSVIQVSVKYFIGGGGGDNNNDNDEDDDVIDDMMVVIVIDLSSSASHLNSLPI